jgi:hypothetical protein
MHPAEVARGLLWEETFSSAASIIRNGGVVTGAPRFDAAKGLYFDGSTYIVYPMWSQLFNTAIWSCVIKFIPDFSYDEATAYAILDTDAGSLTRIYKTAAFRTFVSSCGTTVLNSLSNHDKVWRKNVPTTMMITSRSTSHALSIDGVSQITSAIAISPSTGNTTLYVGCLNAGVIGRFKGWISSIKFFRGNVASDLLSLQEATDYTNNSTFNYEGKASCILPLTMGTYDPTNVLVKDVSGKGNHFSMGDGIAPATYPTKTPTRGMSFDGGDYLARTSGVLFGSNISACVLISLTNVSDYQVALASERFDAAGVGFMTYIAPAASVFRFYCGGIAAANSASAPIKTGLVFLVGVHDDTTTKLYVNGKLGTNAGTPLPPAYHANDNATVGCRAGIGRVTKLLSGNKVLYASMYDFDLTQLQVWDNYLKLLNAINVV